MSHKSTQDVFQIKDVYGIRILVDDTDCAYILLKSISQQIPGYIKNDHISEPKTRNDRPCLRGKQLRLIQYIATKNGVFYEIQITTKEFNRLNEKLHQGYKADKYGS